MVKHSQEGIASWYYPRLSGLRHVAAARTFPIGAKVVVEYGNKKTTVTIIEAGPSFANFNAGRIIDLSPDAFSELENTNVGIIKVKVYGTTTEARTR